MPEPALVAAAEAEELAARKRRATSLRIHMDAEPAHLNPLAGPSVWTARVTADTVFETLVRYEPPPDGAGTGAGSFRPGLAASWKVTQGGKLIRLELRDDVTFHDGSRFSSVDAQFSIDMARSPRVDADHLRRQLADVTAVELAGPRGLRIWLSRPNGYVLRALAEVPMLSDSVYRGKLSPQRGPVVGTGPFRLASWKGGRILLERNDAYWGDAPPIETIELVHDGDAAHALTAAKRGEIDIIPELIREHYPDQAEAAAIEASFAPLRLRPPVLRYIALGQRGPPFDDARVREAVARLVDREEIIEREHGGLAHAVGGPIWPGGPGDGRGPGPLAYDPSAAAKLLDAAGWVDRAGSGKREKGGQRLQVALLALSRGHSAERERIVKALRAAGFFVEVRRGSAGVLLNRLEHAEFDVALLEWHAAVDTDLSPLLETGGKLNYGKFSDQRVDDLLDRLRAAATPAARAKLMPQLADLLAQTWPIVPVSAPDPYGLVHRRVRGVRVWNGWIVLRELSLAHEEE
jgi:peptide/nickel transport system substrate-binding protein